MILLHIGTLVFIAAVAWWFSSYDSKLTGENHKEDFIRRMVRCGLTLFLVEVLIWLPPSVLVIPIFLGVLWAGCLSELFSRGFRWLIDPEDKRKFDPRESVRQLDLIGALIRSGRKAEAIQLCQSLRVSGEVDLTTLEFMLEHLGVPQPATKKTSPLTAASQLRQQGKFNEAKLLLTSLLTENPPNLDAAMMLVRVYAQDLHEPAKAQEVLRTLERQSHIPASHIEFAQRSIHEWSRDKTTPEEAPVQPESIDELLAHRRLGTVVEILEQKTGEQPQDFDLWLKFAEVHAVYCGNVSRAEKIIRRIEVNPVFNAEQVQLAKTKFKEWRETKPQQNQV
jgi:Tetratricopeptide repeat